MGNGLGLDFALMQLCVPACFVSLDISHIGLPVPVPSYSSAPGSSVALGPANSVFFLLPVTLVSLLSP